MPTKFYAHDGGSGGSDNKNKFPEDPGIENGRISDGGGPADGFIYEEGHSTGEGFLGHMEDRKSTSTSHSGGDSEEEKG